MKDDYKQGDRVRILPNSTLPEGLGTICGIACAGAATIGKTWIVCPDKIPGEFTHVPLFSVMLEPVTLNVTSVAKE